MGIEDNKSIPTVRRSCGRPVARHTYATDIMQETRNISVTREIMGLSSTAALGRYQHPALAGIADEINSLSVRNAEKNNRGKSQTSHNRELLTKIVRTSD